MNAFIRKLKLPLSIISLILGGILLFLSIDNIWKLDYFNLEQYIGGYISWIDWIFGVAIIILIAGGYYFGDTVWKMHRFKKLISTSKKSEFSKNLLELRKIATHLHPKYGSQIKKKCKKLKLKKI